MKHKCLESEGRPPEDFCRRMLGSDRDRQGPELPQIRPISFSFPFLV